MTIRPAFHIGSSVRLTSEAIQSYIENGSVIASDVLSVVFRVVAIHTSEKTHPGFDRGAGCALYDLEGLDISLYEWELEEA